MVIIIQEELKVNYFSVTPCWHLWVVGLVWCGGAVGFWKAESQSQGLSYFQALYFCYVSLLTIGYGDLSPRSNAGKPFFIVWSLIAVPTMTILITDMGNTVIASFKRGTFTLADWTVLPKAGIWRTFLEKHPWLLHWLQKKAKEADQRAQEVAINKRLSEGFRTGPADEDIDAPPPTLEQIIDQEDTDNDQTLGRRLALAIRRTAHDLTASTPRTYSYEEWVEFTRLIRFTRFTCKLEREEVEQEHGLVEWDWIGENSPMLADEPECEWLLLRLCESLDRYMLMTRGVSSGQRRFDEKEETRKGEGEQEQKKVKKRKTRWRCGEGGRGVFIYSFILFLPFLSFFHLCVWK